MEKCYVVIRTRFTEVDILRVYKNHRNAAVFVTTMTCKDKDEIISAFTNGDIEVKCCGWTYSIIENILE